LTFNTNFSGTELEIDPPRLKPPGRYHSSPLPDLHELQHFPIRLVAMPVFLLYNIRCDGLQPSEGGRIIKRYHLPDLDALLVARPPQRPANLTPAFHTEKSGSGRDA